MSDDTSAVPGRRTGRPVRLPEDSTPVAGRGRPTTRLAWLLLVSRLLSPDPGLVSRSRFVERLRAEGIAADASRVSRWESGQQDVPLRLLEAYERLLDRPAGSLVLMRRLLHRRAGEPMLDPAPESPDPVGELDDLLARALSGGPAGPPVLSGGDWLLLADRIARFDVVFLDERSWSRLCRQLLNELSRATGFEEFNRWEAASTLVAHRVAGAHMVAAIQDWIAHPHVQRARPVVVLLADSPLPARDDILAGLLLGDSVSPALREAAAIAAVSAVDRGLSTIPLLEHLERYVVAQLAPPRAMVAATTLDVAVHLSPNRLERVLDQIGDLGLRRRVRELAEHPVALPSGVARRHAAAITRAVRAAVPGPVGLVPDPLLERLITESLFHLDTPQRWITGMLLSQSPYGEAYVEECATLASSADAVLAGNAWRSLLTGCDQSASPHLARVALAETRPGLQEIALYVLSRSRCTLDGTQMDRLVALVTAPREPLGIRRAAMGVLGRHDPQRLAALADVGADLAGAARWWLDLGPRI